MSALGQEDTLLGASTMLELAIRQDEIVWSVAGEHVPEILLASDRFRCTETAVTGSFSGSRMSGDFTMTKGEGSILFDMSDAANIDGPNRLGYVPNLPVELQKSQ